MQLRPYFRPLPFVVVLSFAAVAVVDLIHTLRDEAPSAPVLLRRGMVEFEPAEPIIDLRSGRADPTLRVAPEPVFAGALWSEPGPRGRWILGDGAELELTLARGGHRTMRIEARPAAGKRPVRSVGVTVNAVDCGTASLDEGWQWISVKLPEGALRSGSNVMAFSLPDRPAELRSRRALEVRRIALALGENVEPKVTGSSPVTIDFARQAAVISSPGLLVAGFTIDDRVDALRMHYRFNAPGGGAEVTVSRPGGGGIGRDAPVRRVLAPEHDRIERLRIPLHGRRGEFVFRLRVEPRAGRNRLDIRSLELVSERNQRQKAADRDP